MKQLVIASLPLQELTLRSYETTIMALKISITFEHNVNRLVVLQSEITQLEILANHTREVINNNK